MQNLMPPIDSADKLFHDGNPLTGEKGTIVTADFLNNVQGAVRDAQSELILILTEASMVPNPATNGQVIAALKRILLARNNNYFTDTGAVNSLVISPNPPFTALIDGQVFDIACAAANTGATTLKVNELAAYPVLGEAGALQGGEIGVAKGFIRVMWSASTNSFLLTSKNASGPLPVSPATKSNHALQLGQATGRLLATRTWINNGVYVPTAGTSQVRIRLVGGGGGGGGAAATGAGQFSAGGGGIAGAFADTGLIAVPAQGTIVTVGSGGLGAPAGNNIGSSGGISSFGSIISCPGGGGGGGGGASSYSNTVARIGEPSAAPTGATFMSVRGAPATNVVGFSSGLIKGGDGGASFFGSGGSGGHSVTNASASAGFNFGSGGGGPAVGQNGPAVGGADGCRGIVIIEEYA